MRAFAYAEPTTLSEAIDVLALHQGQGWHVLAGGTDVVVMMQQGKMRPEGLMSIARVEGLDHIRVEPGTGARIGAMARIRDMERSSELIGMYPIIGQALRRFGGITIRNMATVGGNLCRGNPSADLPPVFIVLSALFHALGPKGERVIPAEDFFVRPGVTVLEPDELLTEIELPLPVPGGVGAYHKQAPRTVDLANLAVAVWLEVGDGGVCRKARLALAGAAPVPFRACREEEWLEGRRLDEDTLAQVGSIAAEDCRPREDSVRCTPEYRRRLIRVLMARVIEKAVQA